MTIVPSPRDARPPWNKVGAAKHQTSEPGRGGEIACLPLSCLSFVFFRVEPHFTSPTRGFSVI